MKENQFEDYLNEGGEDMNAFVRGVISNMSGGFFVYNAGGDEEVYHINRAALDIFGCSDFDEFVKLTGGTFRGMLHPDDLDRVEQSIAEQVKENKGFDYVEYRIKQKDGSMRWIADYGHLIQTENMGDIFYVFIVDATDRRRKHMTYLEEMNRELRRRAARESQYRRAIQHDAIFFFEANLTENKLISDVTTISEKNIFGILKSLNIGEGTLFTDFAYNCSKRIHEKDAPRFRHFFDKDRLISCLKNGEPEQLFDCNVPDMYGTYHLLHFAVLLGSDVKGAVSALVMAKDITEQARQHTILEATLRQAQSANIAKSTFLASMSHDIRTPLNAILGFVDLIRMNLSDYEDSIIEKYLDKIKSSGVELLSIINESLEVTRTEAGKLALAETECNLNDIFSSVRRAAMPEIESKKLNFTIDVSEINHFSVYADMERLREILSQLLDNAVKYTGNNGTVTLYATENSNLGHFAEYTFTVSDNGPGISEDFLPHLFEPFSRENTSTLSGVSGCGLGMAVVKSMTDLMEGTVKVDSKIGEGTAVTVTLVLKFLEKEVHLNAEDDASIISLKGMRTLLVEDNELNREIAEALLGESDIIVETAEDGERAVEMVKNSKPGYYDFVLMDIQMPKMNGYEATRAIRKLSDPFLSVIPIIALSANAYSEDMKRSLEAGMDAHASKPINMNDLTGMIRSVLRRKNTGIIG